MIEQEYKSSVIVHDFQFYEEFVAMKLEKESKFEILIRKRVLDVFLRIFSKNSVLKEWEEISI